MIVGPQLLLLVFFCVVVYNLDGQAGSGIVPPSQTNLDRNFIDVPPTVAVRCPDKPPVEGEPIVFHADSTKLPRASFKWKVSQGRIINGQGTRTIRIDTNGVGGKKLRASVEMNDGNNHVVTSYCEIDVKPRNSQQIGKVGFYPAEGW
jgi:hypothetical protein